MKNLFFKTNSQKVLKLLLKYPDRQLLPSEIQKSLKISRAGAHKALQELLKNGLIKREQKGKAYVYWPKLELSGLKQFKVLDSTIKIQPLVKKIASLVDKIILFGSCARGEDVDDSDIDLLVITHNKEIVRQKLRQFKRFQIKPIIKTPLEFINLEKKDPSFYLEITRGITLYYQT